MRSVTVAIIVLGIMLGVPFAVSAEETWEEFLSMKRDAEAESAEMSQTNMRPLSARAVREALDGPDQQINLAPYVFFHYGTPRIRSFSFDNLDELARLLKANYSDRRFYVDGHCCSIGSDRNNCRLSWMRAYRVCRELEARGVPRSQISPRGYGFRCPLVRNNSERNRQMNRRVVLVDAGGAQNPCLRNERCGDRRDAWEDDSDRGQRYREPDDPDTPDRRGDDPRYRQEPPRDSDD